MMIEDTSGVSKYGTKSLLEVIQGAVNASNRITQFIFDNIAKADKEIADFTKKLEENKLPNTIASINNQQNKADQLLAVLSHPVSSELDPSAVQDERDKLVAIMGRLQDLKQAALAAPKGVSSGPSAGLGSIA